MNAVLASEGTGSADSASSSSPSSAARSSHDLSASPITGASTARSSRGISMYDMEDVSADANANTDMATQNDSTGSS
jgi:hypothetical protein